MRRRKTGTVVRSALAILLIPAVVGGALRAGAQEKLEAPKKRIAVMNFEDKTDKSYGWGGHYKDAGEGMADMLITALVKTGRYLVVERTELQKVMEEQALGLSGAVTQQTAAKVGELLGAELAVFGVVSEFGYSKGEMGGAKKGVGGFGVGVKSQTATVAVDVRMVNTSTGEIIGAEDVRKDEKKRGLKFSNADLAFGSQSDFDETLVGKATRDAIEEIVKLLDKQAPNIPWRAKVVIAQGEQVIINAGASGGVQVGHQFIVMRPGEELVDPDTGLSLGSMESKIGEIEVVNNMMGDGKASQCKVLTGSGFERGDIVRLKE
jgi:curli biogenesis system outer membrane secretion channel CsgG